MSSSDRRPDVDTVSMATAIDRLVRTAVVATLATIDQSGGHPHPSLVEIATYGDGAPLLLLSRLARHTRNLEADPRAALLYDQRGVGDNPLARERVTLAGEIRPWASVAAEARYVRRHPQGRNYLALGDFGIWRLNVARAHFIGGFGRIRELTADDLPLADSEDPLARQIAAGEAGLIGLVRSHVAPQRDNLDIIGIDVAGVDLMDRASGLGIRAPFGGRPAAFEDIPALAADAIVSIPGPVSGG